jgi:hypothetical protein
MEHVDNACLCIKNAFGKCEKVHDSIHPMDSSLYYLVLKFVSTKDQEHHKFQYNNLKRH